MGQNGNIHIGHGVYSIPEVARYTGLHPQRVRDWFKPQSSSRGHVLFTPDYPPVNSRYAVSFLDLIDVLVASKFREEGISLREIRNAYETLKSDLRTAHPFGRMELYTDGRAIFARFDSSESIAEVCSRQQFWLQVMRPYLKQIDYSPTTKMAERWNISRGVEINPALGFGKPVVRGTAVTTRVLARAFLANDRDSRLVAEHFGVRPVDVRRAVAFEQQYGSLRSTRAA